MSNPPKPPLKESKPIDKVHTDLLDMALRSCNIEIHPDILDRVIDVVELLEEKGEEVSIKDICELKAEWKEHKKTKNQQVTHVYENDLYNLK